MMYYLKHKRDLGENIRQVTNVHTLWLNRTNESTEEKIIIVH